MGSRITEISTPFSGSTLKCVPFEKQNVPSLISPDGKIKVFISSICGVEKYDKIREELKNLIESTQLAQVYTFEGKGASTLTAEHHYTFALEDSDVCIFLIDNKDGINRGVQEELDIVSKYKIKALYYFCDENKKEKTPLEQSLMGANFAKSKTVHSFEDISRGGTQDLLNDIIDVYRYYCKGKLMAYNNFGLGTNIQGVEIAGTEKIQIPIIQKSVLKNVDKCKDYILRLSMSCSYINYPNKVKKSCAIDEWGERFLHVLFEGRSIKEFNVGMFLSELKKEQEKEYYQIVEIRWQAIQSYYLDNIDNAIVQLNNALELARETNQPDWIIKDILIDLRNLNWVLNKEKNYYVESEAQRELTESREEIYYPILDRIHEYLQEKYIKGLYELKITSPYTITIGNDLDSYGELLSSLYVVTIYNGSLTQLLLLYNRIRDFIFYLCNRYNDWNFRRDLLKFAIYEMNEKHIKGIRDYYPEVLNNLSSKDATTIMNFIKNHPRKKDRIISRFYAFGSVGYFLDDNSYEQYESAIIEDIKEWLNEENGSTSIGSSIIYALNGAAYRMSQDTLSDICCLFISKHYSRWYLYLFRFISKYIDLNKMSEKSAIDLISSIIDVLDNDKECIEIKYAPDFLCTLRKQNRKITEELDKKIKEKIPEYYSDIYRLETTENEQIDFLAFIKKYIEDIRTSNTTQGQNGVYSVRSVRSAAVIRAILIDETYHCDNETIDEIISVTEQTLINSQEGIEIRLDTISLLICIAVKYPDSINRNKEKFLKISMFIDKVDGINYSALESNIDSIALKIAICFLSGIIGTDCYSNILELMPLIQDDTATTISVTNIIAEFFEVEENISFSKEIEAIVLQNVLQWLHSNHLDIRWNATRILLALLRNPNNKNVINHQIINLINSDNVYIKNLIMRDIYKNNGIFPVTRDYVVSKCENDFNFVVRMVCEEEKKKYQDDNFAGKII